MKKIYKIYSCMLRNWIAFLPCTIYVLGVHRMLSLCTLGYLREGNFFTSLSSSKVAPSLSHLPLPVLTVFELHVLWRHIGAVLPECRIKRGWGISTCYRSQNWFLLFRADLNPIDLVRKVVQLPQSHPSKKRFTRLY